MRVRARVHYGLFGNIYMLRVFDHNTRTDTDTTHNNHTPNGQHISSVFMCALAEQRAHCADSIIVVAVFCARARRVRLLVSSAFVVHGAHARFVAVVSRKPVFI